MNQLEHDKQIVDDFRKIMQKHRSIGAIRMIECLRFAFEKEVEYAMHRTRSKRNQKTRTGGWEKAACPVD